MQVNRLQKLASYLLPIKIWKGSGTTNPVLELFLYRGEWQLTTEDAIYSDGSRYRPLVAAFHSTKKELKNVRSILVLGSGLGSAVQIVNKMGYFPSFTLVDIDSEVLRVAGQLAKPDQHQHVNAVCSDAKDFIAQTSERYDMVIIDIFSGRKVPPFVSTAAFIEKCRNSINSPGILILNYMINNEEDAESFRIICNRFANPRVIDIGINKVLVATV